jgi:AAHS family 4-hydroxybenzoate transporter-like MFS transporter
VVPARRRNTFGLWISFFGCIFAVYTAFSWLPTMMVGEGFSAGVAGGALTAYNIGGVFGALLWAQGIKRFGSRRPMILAGLASVASILLLKLAPHDQPDLFIVGFGVQGFLINAIACTLYPVSAALYPTAARATGIAVALAFSRLGAILSAFVGAAVITAAGAQGYLSAAAAAMLVSTVGLMVIRNQDT